MRRPPSLRGAALALLAMLAASCSPEPSHQDLVNVEGSVSLRNGPPLAGAIVGFFHSSPMRAPSPMAPDRREARAPATPPLITRALTDTLGEFRIELPEGSWEVWIGGTADNGIMSQHVADVTLRLPSAALELHYLGSRVSGRLIGPGGTALGDGYLSITSGTKTARVSVPSDGYMLLLPNDTYSIWANPSPIGFEAGIPRVLYEVMVSSDTTIDLSLDGHLVSGRATGPGGIPLYGGWVAANSTTASAYSAFAIDGTYSIHLPTREYTFTVYTGGRGDGTHVYAPVLINAPRTLNFDLSGPAPTPAVP